MPPLKWGGWETLVGWWELGAFTGTRGCTPMALAEVRAKGSASLVRLRRARMRWGMICGVCVGGRRSLRGSRVAALSFGEREREGSFAKLVFLENIVKTVVPNTKIRF